MIVAYLVHHAFKMQYVAVVASAVGIVEHGILVLAEITSNYGYCVVLVDDTRLGCHKSVGEKKL